MSRVVYTYRSILEIDQHPKYQELKGLPQLTATAELANAMRNRYPEMVPAVAMLAVQNELTAGWGDRDTTIEQFTSIGEIIRSMNLSRTTDPLYKSFRKNKRDVLNSIRMLVEADVYPEQLLPENREEKLFRAIWEKFEEKTESIGRFRAAMALYRYSPDKCIDKIRRFVAGIDSDAIILHGFYFITPIQERIFDILERSGKKLIFLSCIDSNYPAVHQVWEKTFSPEDRFPMPKKWARDEVQTELPGEPFGALYEGKTVSGDMHRVKIRAYKSEMEFISDIPRIEKEGYTVYSSDARAVEKTLKDFYPNKFKKKHLLAYPVGQYIFQLHTMWNAEKQRIEFSVEDLQECFSSGWVSIDGVNARDYTTDLEKLSVYFSDCRTLDDWEGRMNLLDEIERNVLTPFEAHVESMPSEHQEYHRMMANPFRNFSCFSCDSERTRTVISLIRQLMNTAKELLGDGQAININKHLEKLRRMISHGHDEELLAEEKAVLDELSARLAPSERLKTKTCLPDEMTEAVMLIVGGGILDEEDYSVQLGEDETFVIPLFKIESAPITAGGKIHLCFADEGRLPGRQRGYSWPITGELLRRLDIAASEDARRYVNDLRQVAEVMPLSNRYLFYSVLQNSDVEISWIQKQDDKDVAPAPYVRLLQNVFDLKAEQIEKEELRPENLKMILPAAFVSSFDLPLYADYPQEALLDYCLCPWRFLYSYLLDKRPAFRSAYHYNFAISKTIRAIQNVTRGSKKEVARQVLELFPYLRGVEKRQIYDYVSFEKGQETDSLDGASYPRSRLGVHFLTDKILEQSENLLNQIPEQATVIPKSVYDGPEQGACIYCPFQGNCPHVIKNEGGGGGGQ